MKQKVRESKEPVMVPWTMVPFLSSIETVSLLSFIKTCAIYHKNWKKIKIKKLKINIKQHKEETKFL